MEPIKRGSKRTGLVKLIQGALQKLGYDLVPDGKFGSGTETAVKSFQKKHKLVEDGMVSTPTWLAFAKEAVKQPELLNTDGIPEKLRVKRNSEKTDLVVLIQELLSKLGHSLLVDGDFGPGTKRKIVAFQKSKNLEPNGEVDIKTWLALAKEAIEKADLFKRFLTEKNLQDLADKYNLELAAVKAVNKVEAGHGGRGFWGTKAKILFEGHVFWRRLKARDIDPKTLVKGNEDVLYAKWTTAHYKGGPREYERLEKAMKINKDAALESASWGMFQVMGENWEWLGYESVQEFADLMQKDENEHLKAFGRFIEKKRLSRNRGTVLEALRDKNWERVAEGYNGSGFREHNYHGRLAKAYKKFKG